MNIGLIGLAGAGKDTSAVILQRILKQRGYDFKIDRHAAPLKDAARKVFGTNFDDRQHKEIPIYVDQDKIIQATFELTQVLNFTEEECDKASELFFEHLGHTSRLSPREYQQIVGTEVIRAVRPTAWADRIKASPANLIIPDVRFKNEVPMNNLLLLRYATMPKPAHISEHLAWELQFEHTHLPVNIVEVLNYYSGNDWEVELETRLRSAIEYLNFDGVK